MLERLIIKIHKLVVVVGIYKVVINLGKYKATAYVQLGQHGIVRVFNVEYIFRVKIKVFALLVTQVGIGIPVAYNLAWGFNFDGTVVGTDYHANLFRGQKFQQLE